jgi:hypothetical protein
LRVHDPPRRGNTGRAAADDYHLSIAAAGHTRSAALGMGRAFAQADIAPEHVRSFGPNCKFSRAVLKPAGGPCNPTVRPRVVARGSRGNVRGLSTLTERRVQT